MNEAEIVTLLGRNGAGKTTTLRSLVGLTRPREGSVRIFGNTATGLPPYRIAALGVGYVPEGRRIFANLTIEENLKVPVERPGLWTEDLVYELFPRLEERRSNKGRQLSGGEQEMLAIARVLLLNPKLLLLDEPSQGLAPLIVRDVFRVIRRARESGISVLLVEQNVRAAVEIADRAYVLDDGRVVYEGPAAELGHERRARARACWCERRGLELGPQRSPFLVDRLGTPIYALKFERSRKNPRRRQDGFSPIRTVVSLTKR